jgi:hypothetical protein
MKTDVLAFFVKVSSCVTRQTSFNAFQLNHWLPASRTRCDFATFCGAFRHLTCILLTSLQNKPYLVTEFVPFQPALCVSMNARSASYILTTWISEMRGRPIRIKACWILPLLTYVPPALYHVFAFEVTSRHRSGMMKTALLPDIFPIDTIQFEAVKVSQSDGDGFFKLY